MRWQNPEILLALWILPVLAWLFVRTMRSRARAARQFADDQMIDKLLPPRTGARSWIKGIVLLSGIGLLVVAAARPRWGEYFEEVSSRGIDLFVLLDVSRSMLAEDVAPSRLERAKSDIRDLLAKLQGDRVGLVVFAGAAVIEVPLTTDQGFFRSALEEVDVRSAPRGGTLIGDAIRKAIDAMDDRQDRDRVIVLITDGEDHESFPKEAAEQAAERGIKVFSVGLGDASEGTRIPIRGDDGTLAFLQHDGQEVWSRMDEMLLKEIALETGGAYIPAKTRAYDLGQIYEDHLIKLTAGELASEKRKRYRERFQWFLFLGVGLIMIEMLIPAYPRTDKP